MKRGRGYDYVMSPSTTGRVRPVQPRSSPRVLTASRAVADRQPSTAFQLALDGRSHKQTTPTGLERTERSSGSTAPSPTNGPTPPCSTATTNDSPPSTPGSTTTTGPDRTQRSATTHQQPASHQQPDWELQLDLASRRRPRGRGGAVDAILRVDELDSSHASADIVPFGALPLSSLVRKGVQAVQARE